VPYYPTIGNREIEESHQTNCFRLVNSYKAGINEVLAKFGQNLPSSKTRRKAWAVRSFICPVVRFQTPSLNGNYSPPIVPSFGRIRTSKLHIEKTIKTMQLRSNMAGLTSKLARVLLNNHLVNTGTVPNMFSIVMCDYRHSQSMPTHHHMLEATHEHHQSALPLM
jgi:hypothetical protein